MSSSDDVKVATTYFLAQPDGIRMNQFTTELTLILIIKFQKCLQQCTINIPKNIESLGILGTVISSADYKSVNNNQT